MEIFRRIISNFRRKIPSEKKIIIFKKIKLYYLFSDGYFSIYDRFFPLKILNNFKKIIKFDFQFPTDLFPRKIILFIFRRIYFDFRRIFTSEIFK
jgi:hypothetical protein